MKHAVNRLYWTILDVRQADFLSANLRSPEFQASFGW